MEGVRARKRAMVAAEIEAHRARFAVPQLTFLLAEGRLVGPRTVEARLAAGGTRRFVVDRLFLDLGTRATIPSVPGLADAAPLTHVEALELGRLPSHLVVLGAGHVAVELAQAFRRFGSKVTLVGRGGQLMSREDLDVAAVLRAIFEDEGIDVRLGAAPVSVDGTSGQRVRLRVKTAAREETIEGSDLLVATGRTPNTRGIGLEEAGIILDAAGYIRVDERLQTTAPGVWAMGECAGSPKYTHVAFDDFRVVRDNLAGTSRTTRGRLVPYCVFTDPEFAHVGDVRCIVLGRHAGDTRVRRWLEVAASVPAFIGFAVGRTTFVAGAGKAERLYEVLEGPPPSPPLAVQRIHPTHGALTWMVDAAAAQRLRQGAVTTIERAEGERR